MMYLVERFRSQLERLARNSLTERQVSEMELAVRLNLLPVGVEVLLSNPLSIEDSLVVLGALGVDVSVHVLP